MPQYKLNDIPVDLWARFKDRAQREGWPLRALFLQLMDDYATDRVRPSGAPPEQMPMYAWMRPYYRDLVREDPTFAELDAQIQWERLVEHIRAQRPGRIAELPIDRARQVLNWLHDTSQDARPGPNKLSMRAISWIGHGPSLAEKRRAIQFEVLGLEPSRQAWIAHFQGEGWKTLWATNGQQGKWEGPAQATADEALAAIEAELYFGEGDRD